MEFVKVKDEFGVNAAKLDISDLNLELDKDNENLLIFSLKKYIKLGSDGNKKSVEEGIKDWNCTFALVNQFFSLQPKEINEKIAKAFIIIHSDVLEYTSKLLNDRNQTPDRFVKSEGQVLLELDDEIDLLAKFDKFITDGFIQPEDQSKKGKRPQDDPEATWYNDEIQQLTSCVLLSKMMAPCFSIVMLNLEKMEGFEFDTDIQILYASQLVLPLLIKKREHIVNKLEKYIELNYNPDSNQELNKIMTGITTYSNIHRLLNTVITRPFVNIDIGVPGCNPMSYIHTVIQSTGANPQGKTAPISIRDTNKYLADDDTTSTLEWDSSATSKSFDIPVIAKTFAPKVARNVAKNYGISDDELSQCLEFYKTSPFQISFLAHSLVAGFFGRRLGGGASISLLSYGQFVELVIVIQLICMIDKLHLLGHLLTAKHGIRSKTHYSSEETQLKFVAEISDHYRNCASRYTYLSDDVWHNAIKDKIIEEEVLARYYYYNTASVIWNHFPQNYNGKMIELDRTLPKQISTFVETHV